MNRSSWTQRHLPPPAAATLTTDDVATADVRETAGVDDLAGATLLELQELDTRADQLRHRREALPERGARAGRVRALAELDQRLEVRQGETAELARAQRRLEDEVASLDARAVAEDGRLYSGTVTSPRELAAIQDEVASLRAHVSSIEDQVLEVMERGEPLAAEVAQLVADRTAVLAELAALDRAIAESEAEIDSQLAQLEATRVEAAAVVPAELRSEYEVLRSRLGGVAVARLEGDRCLGCHLSLPAGELSRIRRAPADAVVHHEECGRILVR